MPCLALPSVFFHLPRLPSANPSAPLDSSHSIPQYPLTILTDPELQSTPGINSPNLVQCLHVAHLFTPLNSSPRSTPLLIPFLHPLLPSLDSTPIAYPHPIPSRLLVFYPYRDHSILCSPPAFSNECISSLRRPFHPSRSDLFHQHHLQTSSMPCRSLRSMHPRRCRLTCCTKADGGRWYFEAG